MEGKGNSLETFILYLNQLILDEIELFQEISDYLLLPFKIYFEDVPSAFSLNHEFLLEMKECVITLMEILKQTERDTWILEDITTTLQLISNYCYRQQFEEKKIRLGDIFE